MPIDMPTKLISTPAPTTMRIATAVEIAVVVRRYPDRRDVDPEAGIGENRIAANAVADAVNEDATVVGIGTIEGDQVPFAGHRPPDQVVVRGDEDARRRAAKINRTAGIRADPVALHGVTAATVEADVFLAAGRDHVSCAGRAPADQNAATKTAHQDAA